MNKWSESYVDEGFSFCFVQCRSCTRFYFDFGNRITLTLGQAPKALSHRKVG